MSNHAPYCDEFKQEEFTRLTLDKITCVMDPREAMAMLTESDEPYVVSMIMLTRDQFERMSEFDGF